MENKENILKQTVEESKSENPSEQGRAMRLKRELFEANGEDKVKKAVEYVEHLKGLEPGGIYTQKVIDREIKDTEEIIKNLGFNN